MCANFGDPRSRDCQLRQKTLKKAIFGLKNYWFASNSKTIWRAQLKFWHSVGAYKRFMQTQFGGARSRDQNVTGRKWVYLVNISVNTDIDEKYFMVFKHTFHHFPLNYDRLPQLEYYFSCFASFF